MKTITRSKLIRIKKDKLAKGFMTAVLAAAIGLFLLGWGIAFFAFLITFYVQVKQVEKKMALIESKYNIDEDVPGYEGIDDEDLYY